MTRQSATHSVTFKATFQVHVSTFTNERMRLLQDFLIWLFLIKAVEACVRTVPTPTPVCQTCSLNTIQLTPASGPGTINVGSSGVSIGPNGCNQLTVICDAGPGNTAFMQFNINQGGPNMAIGQVVTATLVCDNNGNWVYTGANGQSRVIMEVNCVATM